MFKYKVLWLDKNNDDQESTITAKDYDDVVKKLKKKDKNFNMITIRNLGEA